MLRDSEVQCLAPPFVFGRLMWWSTTPQAPLALWRGDGSVLLNGCLSAHVMSRDGNALMCIIQPDYFL